MTRRLEFEIQTDDIQWDGRRLVVQGRCMAGPVFVGDTFDVIRSGGTSRPATLTIVEIRAYGHLLDQLDPVVTAELLLIGEGGDVVANPTTLAGTAPVR